MPQASRSRGAALAVALSVAALVIIPSVALGVAGDFSQPSTSPEAAGIAPISVLATDLDGGGGTDLVVSDFVDDDIAILLGDGSGNFTAAPTSPETVGSTSNSVAAAKLDGDANTDLAAANLDTANVTILLGDGTGNFTAAGTSPEVAGTGPLSIVAAKLDGDANTDLAVANSSNDVTILLGDGTGNFTAAASSPEAVGTGPRMIVAANFDGDADVDLATANRSSDDVTILLNNGSGNFTAASESAGDDPSGLVTANLGGSTSTDLAISNRNADTVTILLGDGTGNFTAAGSSPEKVGDAPRSLVATNLGGSGSIDLAVANAESDDVTILLGNGNGNFTAAGSSPEKVGDQPFSIAAASFGGGPGIDLATANPQGGDVSILLNDAPSSVKPPIVPPVVTPPLEPEKLTCQKKEATVTRSAAGTFKGTSKKDVIVGTTGNDKISAGGGNDLVCAGGGKDVVKGGGGKDKLYGERGKDKLIGGGGKDKLVGAAGKDKLVGGGGKDTCVGGKGADTAQSCEKGKI